MTRKNLAKYSLFLGIFAFALIPTFAFSEEAPVTGGDASGADANASESSSPDYNSGTTGAESNTPPGTAPETGVDTTGAVSVNTPVQPPSTSVGTTGAESNTPPAITPDTGADANGATINAASVPAPATGGDANGADVQKSSDPAPTPSPLVVSSSGGHSSSAIVACSPVSSYLRRGSDNDSAEVTKLQNFLKNNEKYEVDVNGIFDLKTENAVKLFQAKYRETILDPWSTTAQPTGNVYITTLKKINQLACNSIMTLSPEEVEILSAYKRSLMTDRTPSSPSITPEVAPGTSKGSLLEIATSSGPVLPASFEVGQGDQESNTASVGRAGILQKFWGFVKSLFE